MTLPGAIDENDLGAYVDGELDADAIDEVERWLAQHPEDAAKVHAYRLQKSQLHELFDGELTAPPPAGVSEAIRAHRRPSRRPVWMQMAAGLVIFVAGGLAGWGIIGASGGNGADEGEFVRRAIYAHAIFTHEASRPVEIGGAEKARLVSWLSQSLGEKLMTPDLEGAGFKLMGGRLLADKNMPAAQFMYQGRGAKRVTLYVRAGITRRDTAFRFVAEKGMVAFYWTNGKLSYALTGAMPRGDLLDLAQMVFRDIDAQL